MWSDPVAMFHTLMMPSVPLWNPTNKNPPASSIESTSPPTSTQVTACKLLQPHVNTKIVWPLEGACCKAKQKGCKHGCNRPGCIYLPGHRTPRPNCTIKRCSINLRASRGGPTFPCKAPGKGNWGHISECMKSVSRNWSASLSQT
eukprot:1159998-Pelagomonas_calceolata.AAC.3